MGYYDDSGPGGLIIVAIIILAVLIFIAPDSEPTTYWHAKVGDVVMSTGHDCEFGVLYNQDGILMEDIDGINIECENILLTKIQWKMMPYNVVKEFEVDPNK